MPTARRSPRPSKLVVLFVGALANASCGRSEPATTTKEPAKVTPKAADKVLHPVDANKPQVVPVGARLDVRVTSPAGGGKKFTWRAEVSGGAISADGVDTVAPPKEDDGGRYRHDFHFVAAEKGTAKITLVPSNDADDALTFVVTVE